MIEIHGLNPLQRELCDCIWSMDTQEEIMTWFKTLPESIVHEAHVMMQMIMLASLDNMCTDDFEVARTVIEKIKNGK